MDTQTSKFWKDKRVLITGGTAGLGRAITKRLSELGAHITIVARGKEKLDRFSKNKNIHAIQADLGKKTDIHPIFSQAMGLMDGIDLLINNASTLGTDSLKPLVDTVCEEIELGLQVNLLGPFRLTKLVLGHMIMKQSGLIINISSDAARHAYPTWGAYSISKAALDHLSAIWQEELKMANIDVIALDPGDMYTDLHLKAIPDADPANLYSPDQVADQLIRFIEVSPFTEPRYGAGEWRSEIE